MGVTSQHEGYTGNLATWQRCRDFFNGSKSVKKAGATYLPKLSGQDDRDYLAYKDRALFYNATARTVSGLLGRVFRKAPQIIMPPGLDECQQDITQTCVPLELFSKGVTREILVTGRCGVLVDMATEQLTDSRPYLALYTAEQIVNWRTERINGELVLTMVVLREKAEEPDEKDPFVLDEIEQYRVLLLQEGKYVSQLWRKADSEKEDSWVVFDEQIPNKRGQAFDFIPFHFFGPNVTTPDIDRPPLDDLVDVNLSHYHTSADIEHGRHFTALPTVWVAGFDVDSDLRIGSGTAWVTNRTDAKAGMLEFTGQGLGALEKALDDKENKMAALGARILEKQKTGNAEAADTVRLRQAGEQSTLQGIANSISLGLTQVLRWFCFWAGNESDASITLNSDYFETDMDPQRLTALVGVWQGGGISSETLYFNLQKGGITRPGVDFETELQDIKAGMPAPLADSSTVPDSAEM